MDLMGLEGTLCFLYTLDIALDLVNGIAGLIRSLRAGTGYPGVVLLFCIQDRLCFIISRRQTNYFL